MEQQCNNQLLHCDSKHHEDQRGDATASWCEANSTEGSRYSRRLQQLLALELLLL
jgi:hypothetical protein